jgi:hypothetical protein
MNTNTSVDTHFSAESSNGFTDKTPQVVGTTDTGWWDYVPWDTIGNNVDGLFSWLNSNNGNYGAPTYQQQQQMSLTTMLLIGGGGFLFIMVLMVVLIKLSK